MGFARGAVMLTSFVFIGKGLWVTLQLMCGGLAIGLVLGTLFSILRYNGIGVFIVNRLISVLRGTPLLFAVEFGLFLFAWPRIEVGCDNFWHTDFWG